MSTSVILCFNKYRQGDIGREGKGEGGEGRGGADGQRRVIKGGKEGRGGDPVCIFKFSLVTVVTVTYAAMSDKNPNFSEEKNAVGLAAG